MPYTPKPTAIINEQTAAYAVIPVIKAFLQSTFSGVIPINFWSTREGTGKALASLTGCRMKILAVYPRRPKTLNDQPDSLFIKLNQKLYDHAAELTLNGIPVIGAAPLAQGLNDLANEVKCCYLTIEQGQDEQIVKICIDPYEIHPPCISEQGVLELMNDKAQIMGYWNAISAIRNNNNREYSFFMFNRWGQYKPIYFLCLTD